MNRIPLDKLLTKADSRYSLVVAAAKRAREITAGQLENEGKDAGDAGLKAVSLALEEIAEGVVEIKGKNIRNIGG